MINSDTIRKAILLESQYLLGLQKSGANVDPTTLDEVIGFYTQLRECFQFEVDYSAIFDKMYSPMSMIDDRPERMKEIVKWLKENNIVIYFDKPFTSFFFISEEDAIAFKLKWI